MFDIGIWEILLILVLALLVIGPERLPGAARTAGLWVGRARRYVEGVKSEVEQEFDVSEFKRIVHNQEIQLNELQQKLNLANPLEGDKESSSEENIHEIMDEIMNEGREDEDPIPTNEDKKIDDEKD
jgi:sec-independent protein translocase protein TatB